MERQNKNPLDSEVYNQKRAELLFQLALINSVGNMTGKGRDDLTDIKILQAAEQIPNELLLGQAQSVQVLADKIRSVVKCFRHLLRKYAQNLDAIDPQMKNNLELVEILEVYESSWSLGKDQLLDSCHRHQLIKFA